jgi:hypothetical protein
MAYMGGSAFAMANSFAEGYILPSPATLKRLEVDELRAVLFEMDKLLKELRGLIVDPTDTMTLQKRNQRIQKLNSATMVINNQLAMKVRGRA